MLCRRAECCRSGVTKGGGRTAPGDTLHRVGVTPEGKKICEQIYTE